MELGMPLVDFGQLARGARDRGALAAPAHGAAGSEVRLAAQEFEAVFLSEMLAPMFEDLDSDPLFGGGPGERMYRSMLVEEYGKVIARAGGVGIADAVERELLRLQEAHRP